MYHERVYIPWHEKRTHSLDHVSVRGPGQETGSNIDKWHWDHEKAVYLQGEGLFSSACLTIDSISESLKGESVSLIVYTLLRLVVASMNDCAEDMAIAKIGDKRRPRCLKCCGRRCGLSLSALARWTSRYQSAQMQPYKHS